MAFRSQTPGATDALYFSPLTRSAEFLVGVTLAAYRAANRGFPAQIGRLCTRIAPIALVVMLGIWLRVDVAGPFAYQGGFLLHALITAILIIAALTPGRFSSVLGWRPLAYTGRFSYGMYVYHWPIILFLTDEVIHLRGNAAIAVRFAAVVPLAVVSYFVIERPFRYGKPSRMASLPLVAIAAVGLTAFGIVRVSTNPPKPTLKLDRVETKVSAADAILTVLVVGDSQANNIARGLADTAPPNVRLVDRSRPGCGLALGERRTEARWVPDDPRCVPPWPAQYATDVATVKPDVVVALFGSQETWDRRIDGVEYPFDGSGAAALRESEVAQAAQIFTSTGASLLWLTAPTDHWVGWGAVLIEDEARSMNNPDWIQRWNDSVRAVLEGGSATAPKGGQSSRTVLDLNTLMTPGNVFSETRDGVVVREVDGLHFTAAGRAMIAKWLWPQILTAGKDEAHS